MSRRVARLIPFYEFDINDFFGSDGAPAAVATQRQDGFFRLVRGQHRALSAHPGLHRDLSLRARSRDGRAGRRGRSQQLHCGRDEVVIDPCIPCLPLDIHPPCTNCGRGWTSCCLNLDSRIVSSGRSLGYTMDLGGGWAESVLAHESMPHPMPDAIDDRAPASTNRWSIACHGLMRATPDDGEPVLIVGAGIIGSASLAVLRGSFRAARSPSWPDTGTRVRPLWRAGRTTSCTPTGQRPLGGTGVPQRRTRRRPQTPSDADGRVPLRIEAVGSPDPSPRPSGRWPTGAASSFSVQPGSARSTYADLVQGGGVDRLHRLTVERTRRPGWPGAPTGTPSTGRSTCSPRVSAAHSGRDARVRAGGLPGGHRTAIDRNVSHAIKVVFRP